MKINLKLNQKEYEKHFVKRQSWWKSLSKREQTGWLFIFLSSFDLVCVMVWVSTMFSQPATGPNIFRRWMIESLGLAAALDWSTLGKWMIILLAPVFAVSWIIHGVKVRLLA